MYCTKCYEIASTDDIELNIQRDSQLEFKVSFDDEKEMKALFFFFPGCGMEMNEDYLEYLAEFVVKEFDVAMVRVNYHCIGNRPQMGAKFYLDTIDRLIISQVCQTLNINIPQDFFPNRDMNENEMLFLFSHISGELSKLKNLGVLKKEALLYFTATLEPTKNEYQNFGIMQALDIINVLYYIKNNLPFKLSNDYKTILSGSSHGAYLALLVTKIVPWLVDAVLENSGYVNPSLRYIGFGKEIDYQELAELFDTRIEHIIIACSSKTHWTSNKSSQNHFSKAHAKIRSLLDEEHLKIMASYNKPKIISYHAQSDLDIAPASEKEQFHHYLHNLGFDSKLYMMSEKDVDGKLIKNAQGHGMDISFKAFLKKELPPLLINEFAIKAKKAKGITYLSENLKYSFKENTKGAGVELKLVKIEN
mgnify:FL=1